jgi:AMMECR1 domain-containing protein
LKGQTEREKVYGISVNKPAILINKNDLNTYCYLPSIWKDQSDAIYILENLAINANLEKDDWKNNDLNLITFKPTLVTIN